MALVAFEFVHVGRRDVVEVRMFNTPNKLEVLSAHTGEPELSLALVQRNPDEETIILKDKDKNLKNYRESPKTRAMRNHLERINQVLNANFIDLRLTDAEFAELDKLLVKRGQQNPDTQDPNKNGLAVTAKTLHRVFNNGSFEEGGRFYGGFWMSIPREYRKRVVINDKATVELDYSAIHARILYAKEGLNLPDDPFNKVGFGEANRQLVKDCFYALVNTYDRVMEFPEFKEAGLGITWNEFCNRIIEAHAPIKRYFKSGYGLKLMRMDSDIAEQVMLHFAKYGIPVLPVHDSFLMHHGYERELREVMAEAFTAVVGRSPGISTRAPYRAKASDSDEVEPLDSDFDEILVKLNESSIYEARLAAHRNAIASGRIRNPRI